MTPMKFDEHIKEQLEQRSLPPSNDAWNKLEQCLDQYENKGKNKNLWWIGIAASFIGVLLVVGFLLKNEKATVETNVLVNIEQPDVKQNTPIKKESTVINPTKETQVADVNLQETEEKVNQIQPVVAKTEIKQKLSKSQENIKFNTYKDAVAEVEVDKQKTSETLQINSIQSQDIETSKAEEVALQILKLQETKAGVTDEEIEALLDAAHKEITLQKIYNEDTKTVDADALLRDVEFDIEEESFRTKVFEMLKAGYKEVKTAVAERNN